MKSAKKYNKETEQNLKNLLSKLGKQRTKFPVVITGENYNIKKNDKQIDTDREIIRRLRIQNKKLLEQVIKLKEDIKKTKINRIQVLNHINELLKLIEH